MECAAMAGGSGELFTRAVTAVLAAHCAAFNHTTRHLWPEDRTDDVLQKFRDGHLNSYDFIVVGAGTAGSLLASRLSNMFPSWKILLVEAGTFPTKDTEMPTYVFGGNRGIGDWNYKTLPEDNACKGFLNNQCIWNKGKCLGGSSTINAMIYLRGHPDDFNKWKEAGNTHWGYEDVKPYFERVEKTFNYKINTNRDQTQPLMNIVTDAWSELGYDSKINLNNDEAFIGTKVARLTMENGKRLNTAQMYLEGAKNNSNFHVINNAVVTRIIVDRLTKIAQSVEITLSRGDIIEIKANKEIILSAGSIATPHLLMLSGIGPKQHLDKIGIDTLVNLPVGENLQDHVFLPLFFQFDRKYSYEVSANAFNLFLVEYLLTSSGPFSNIGIIDLNCFVNTNRSEKQPNIQFFHASYPKNDTPVLKTYLKNLSYKKDIIKTICNLNKENNLLSIHPALLHPNSRGKIYLADKDPARPPLIKPNYYKDTRDMETMIKAIKIAQNLSETEAFKNFGLTLPRLAIRACAHTNFNSRQYWECYIRHMSNTVYHPVGTAKMGTTADSVVDSDLQVKGVGGLRVVDASVMPFIPSANTMAATLMIAEKASVIILDHYNKKEEL